MGTLIDKIGIKTGKDSSNSFNLSCFHATTSKFFDPRITYCHEFVPGEKWNIDARCSVTCMPLQRPLMGDIKVHNRFFFVPFYSIFSKWNAFLAETPVSNNAGATLTHPRCPQIDEVVLVNWFRSQSGHIYEYDDHPDFYYADTPYRLTDLGKRTYSILLGLGYNIDLTISSSSTSAKLSMLPLLSYLKVYLDWYNNSAFDTFTHLESLFDRDGDFGPDDLTAIFDAISTIYFEKDYFTSSTLYPTGPNSSNMQLPHSIPDITVSEDFRTTVHSQNYAATKFTPTITPTSGDRDLVTKYSIDAVNALTDYVKRHQLAGIQPFNRILAEYGVTLSDEELRRSTFIGDNVIDVDVKTVVSNGYADDTILGERSGLGDGGQRSHFDFSNDNFGMIICVTTVVPRLSYVDGIKRHCLRTQRFDFFTPSVEHLGVEPVLCKELFNCFTSENPSTVKPAKDRIFGYMPRYAAYKTALDTMSGDFMIKSRRTELDPWILRRDLHPSSIQPDYLTISRQFTAADNSDVNNLFVDEESDQFVIFNMYHVKARLPMHKLFDDYQWSNENDNPKDVTIHNQGIQLT